MSAWSTVFEVNAGTAEDREVVRHRHRADQVGARYSYRVSKVDDGKCEQVAGTNTDMSLPLASIFKLYVLLAVSDAVKAGTAQVGRSPDDHQRRQEARLCRAGQASPGAQITVRTAAQQMISASDNMATDLLIERMGPARRWNVRWSPRVTTIRPA